MSFYDILALLIFVVMMLFWMMVLAPPERKSVEIREQIHFFDHEDMLIAILKMPYRDRTVLEHIYEENKDLVNEAVKRALEPVFGPVCFHLNIDDEKFTETNCKEILKQELMKAEVYVPKDKQASVKIELIVPGYAE